MESTRYEQLYCLLCKELLVYRRKTSLLVTKILYPICIMLAVFLIDQAVSRSESRYRVPQIHELIKPCYDKLKSLYGEEDFKNMGEGCVMVSMAGTLSTAAWPTLFLQGETVNIEQFKSTLLAKMFDPFPESTQYCNKIHGCVRTFNETTQTEEFTKFQADPVTFSSISWSGPQSYVLHRNYTEFSLASSGLTKNHWVTLDNALSQSVLKLWDFNLDINSYMAINKQEKNITDYFCHAYHGSDLVPDTAFDCETSKRYRTAI